MNFKEYYLRRDVIKEFVRISKDREVQAWFKDMPGKRPDIINLEGDVLDYVNKGMSSLHLSTERWNDPLRLKTGMTKKDLDELRKGWDYIIDIDCKVLEYSKIAAFYILDLFKFYNIKGVSLKFSGGTGFHIGLCFESFPSEVNNIKIKNLFPDGLHILVSYMKNMIKEHVTKDLLKLNSINEIALKIGKPKESLYVNGAFDPFSVVGIDTVLISSRHLFRSPYSFNEKKWLVSVPLKISDLNDFNTEMAKPENVKVKLKFLDSELSVKGEANSLLLDAFDFELKKKKNVNEKNVIYELPKNAINSEFFPPCMKILVNGVKVDGRKRGLFILLNFLRNSGYGLDAAEKMINDWNKNNYELLKEGYIKAQLSWFKKQNKLILPPNCDNQAYYQAMGICKPDNFCKMIKNPVNYAVRKSRMKKG